MNSSSIYNRVELFSEFSHSRVKNHREKEKKDIPDLNCDSPFEPTVIHKMLNGIRPDLFQVEGRQEDAEEFLGCVLNGLNDEMLEVSTKFHFIMYYFIRSHP